MGRIEGASRADMFLMDPEKIVIPTEGPLYDERTDWPVNEALVANIRHCGQLQAILVRKNGDNVEVVSGRQRLKAILEINRQAQERGEKLMKIKCDLSVGSDCDAYTAMISENEIRKDDDPFVKAEKAKRLLKYGSTVKDIAVTYGKDIRTVEGWLALTEVAPEVQEAVRSGEIAAGVGVALSELPRDQQAAKLEELKKEGKATVKQTQREVRAESRPGRPPALPMPARKDLQGLLDKLTAEPIGEQTPQVEGFSLCLEFVLGLIPEETALATLIPEAPKEAAQTRPEAPKAADKAPHEADKAPAKVAVEAPVVDPKAADKAPHEADKAPAKTADKRPHKPTAKAA